MLPQGHKGSFSLRNKVALSPAVCELNWEWTGQLFSHIHLNQGELLEDEGSEVGYVFKQEKKVGWGLQEERLI